MMELGAEGKMQKVRGLEYSYDAREDVLTIEGVKYAGDFFRMLSVDGVRLMEPIVIRKRGADGVIEIQRVTKENFEEVFR